MLLTEYDEAEAMELFREEGREEGRKEGREEQARTFYARMIVAGFPPEQARELAFG